LPLSVLSLLCNVNVKYNYLLSRNQMIFSHCCIYRSAYHISDISYNVSNTSYLISPPSIIILYSSPPPLPGIISETFPFTYMCTQYLHYIHLPTLFPHLLPPHNWYQPHPSTQDLFHPSSVFQLWEGKNWHFHSFKISTEGVSLWLSMYICIITQIGSSLFLFFLPLFPS
jgi:hypothetical protein